MTQPNDTITGTWTRRGQRIDVKRQGDRYYAIICGFWGAIADGGRPVVFPTTDDARQAIQRIEADGYIRQQATPHIRPPIGPIGRLIQRWTTARSHT